MYLILREINPAVYFGILEEYFYEKPVDPHKPRDFSPPLILEAR